MKISGCNRLPLMNIARAAGFLLFALGGLGLLSPAQAADQAERAADRAERAADKAVKAADEATKASKDKPNDSWLTAKTKIALLADSRVSGTRVNVQTQGGSVTLRGKVETMDAKSAAEEIARGIDGVREVKNELAIVAASKRKLVDAKDDYIVAEVGKRLKRDQMLKSAKITVRSDAGMVTLSGQAPGLMASARASELADEVEGVRTVKNELALK